MSDEANLEALTGHNAAQRYLNDRRHNASHGHGPSTRSVMDEHFSRCIAEARALAIEEAARIVLSFRPTGENAKHFVDVLVCDIAEAVRKGKRNV